MEKSSSLDHWTPQGGLVRRTRPLEQARSLGQTLHLLLGRRHSRAGPSRRQRPMPADHHRSHTRGQEGACRPHHGVRESAQSWRELLLDLKRRGLSIGPELAVADGALGFWQAVEEVWPQTRGEQPATESQAGFKALNVGAGCRRSG
jgi:hypothetical protein